MGLNIIVMAKQVPDTKNIKGNAMKEDGTVNRDVLPAIFNPEDLHALEAALYIKEQFEGSRVHVISMGPPAAAQILKESLYRGADSVVLISDRKFAGADTLATSYALKCAIEKIGSFDLIFCGRQAIDGDTAQVGPQTAEKLNLNQITCVSRIDNIDIEKREIVATRSIEGGFEKVKTNLPLLMTFTHEGYFPRPPSAKKVMAYKNASIVTDEDKFDESYLKTEEMLNKTGAIDIWNVSSINANPDHCGLSGSPTKVKHIESIVLTSSDIKMVENSEAKIAEMIHELISDHTLD